MLAKGDCPLTDLKPGSQADILRKRLAELEALRDKGQKDAEPETEPTESKEETSKPKKSKTEKTKNEKPEDEKPKQPMTEEPVSAPKTDKKFAGIKELDIARRVEQYRVAPVDIL